MVVTYGGNQAKTLTPQQQAKIDKRPDQLNKANGVVKIGGNSVGPSTFSGTTAPAPAAAPVAPINTYPQEGNIGTLGQLGQSVANLGGEQSLQGGDMAKGSYDQLNNLTSDFYKALQGYGGQATNAGDKTFDYLTKAMAAEPGQEFLNNVTARQGDRDALITKNFSDQGSAGRGFNDQRNSYYSMLANELNMPNSSVGAATAGELQTRREAAQNDAFLNSLTQSQKEYTDERNRISGVGSNAANTSAGLTGTYTGAANQAGGLANQAQSTAGQLGSTLANIGGQNLQTGGTQQAGAIDAGLSGLTFEANLRQAQQILENMFRQQTLNNMTGAKQNKYNQGIMDQLYPPLMGNFS